MHRSKTLLYRSPRRKWPSASNVLRLMTSSESIAIRSGLVMVFKQVEVEQVVMLALQELSTNHRVEKANRCLFDDMLGLFRRRDR